MRSPSGTTGCAVSSGQARLLLSFDLDELARKYHEVVSESELNRYELKSLTSRLGEAAPDARVAHYGELHFVFAFRVERDLMLIHHSRVRVRGVRATRKLWGTDEQISQLPSTQTLKKARTKAAYGGGLS